MLLLRQIHRKRKQVVDVYDIVAEKTIDSFIYENLSGKQNLVESFKRYLKENKKKSQRKEVKNHDRVRENEKHGC